MLSDSWVKQEFKPQDELAIQRQEQLLEEMGLTDRDTKKLRQQMLSADEAVCAKKEELTRIRQTKGRKENWLAFLDIKARMGRTLEHPQLIHLLSEAFPRLRCADGRVRNTISIFYPICRTWDDGKHWGHQYLGWMHKGWNPEYEIDYVDEDGVPRGQRRGWRTTLLNAIIAKDGTGTWTMKGTEVVLDGTGLPLKMLTENRALEVFGPLTARPPANTACKCLSLEMGASLIRLRSHRGDYVKEKEESF